MGRHPDGLNLLDRSRGTFTAFTTKDGLPDDTDSRQSWKTARGISGWLRITASADFIRRRRPFAIIRKRTACRADLLNPYGAEGSWQSPDGEMVFGSTERRDHVLSRSAFAQSLRPAGRIDRLPAVQQAGAPGLGLSAPQANLGDRFLTLTHTQSIFTLEFAGLSYAAPEKNRYRYRLEGLESEWNEVDSRRRQATYTSLPAGRYVFRVQASNKDGVWNEKGVTLAITVLPPWWATWWFRSLMGLAFVGLIARRLQIAGRWTEAA